MDNPTEIQSYSEWKKREIVCNCNTNFVLAENW